MRNKQKKVQTMLVLRQHLTSADAKEKALSGAAVYGMHGLMLFIWMVGCLKWLDEMLSLHVAMAPLVFAVGVFCLIFEAAVRLDCIWRLAGAAFLACIADIWLNADSIASGCTMIACQAVRAISEYYHIQWEIDNITMNTAMTGHVFILLAAAGVLLAGVSTVKWRSGIIPGMFFVLILTASLMTDHFPAIFSVVLVLTGAGGLLSLSGIEGQSTDRGRGSLQYIKTGLLMLCLIAAVSTVSYYAADRFVAGRMNQYNEYVHEYSQQAIDDVSRILIGRDDEPSLLEQWMNGVTADFSNESGALTNQAPIQTGAVVLRVEAAEKPDAPVYFRSYIGGSYDSVKDQWIMLNDEAFLEACREWTAYSYMSYEDMKVALSEQLFNILETNRVAEGCRYRVENVSANHSYTWMPYGVHTDNLTPEADGIMPAGSQELFEGFVLPDSIELMHMLEGNAYFEDTQELINEYTAYVYNYYLQVPDGLASLEAGAAALAWEYEDTSIEERIQAVQDNLKENCSYERYGLSAAPAGVSLIDNFYGTSHEGYCIHFASAGALLLRMMSVPARYATGYVAWPEDFEYDEENHCYRANITGYGGHAWVEVYDDEAGVWLPVEMTPSDSIRNVGTDIDENDSSEVTDTAASEAPDTQAEDTTERIETQSVVDHDRETDDPVDDDYQFETNSSRNDMDSQDTEPVTGNSHQDDANQEALPAVWPIVLAAAVLIIAAASGIYWVKGNGNGRRFSRVNRNKALLSMEEYLAEAMATAGWKPDSGADDWSYAKWVQSRVDDLEDGEFIFFMEMLHQAAYSEEMLTEEEYQRCYRTYQKIIGKITGEMKGLRRFWWRHIRGYK